MREAIVDAAIETLARNPAASLSEIANRAGVGRASLHRHFPARDDLLAAVIRQCRREINEATSAALEGATSSRERLSRTLQAIIPLGDRYSFLAGVVADAEEMRAEDEAEREWLEQLVDDLKAEGTLAADVSRAWAAANIDSLIWNAWSEVARGHLASAHAADLALRTLLQGLGGAVSAPLPPASRRPIARQPTPQRHGSRSQLSQRTTP